MKILIVIVSALMIIVSQASAETTCRIINMYTTQTGQAIYKISCPSVVANPGDLITVKKEKGK